MITYDWASSIAALAPVALDVQTLRDNDTWVRVLGETGLFPKRVVDFPVSDASFHASDVVRVIARTDGCANEYAWVGVFELSDGRFAYVDADIETDTDNEYDDDYGHVVGDSFVCLGLDCLVRYVRTRTNRLTGQLPAILPTS